MLNYLNCSAVLLLVLLEPRCYQKNSLIQREKIVIAQFQTCCAVCFEALLNTKKISSFEHLTLKSSSKVRKKKVINK